MKNNPDHKAFENQWREAFDSAELKPSDGVWKGVDAHLANKAAGNYKRGIVFYRWVAAASILMLLTWGGYWYTTTLGTDSQNKVPFVTEDTSTQPEENSPALFTERESESSDELLVADEDEKDNRLAVSVDDHQITEKGSQGSQQIIVSNQEVIPVTNRVQNGDMLGIEKNEQILLSEGYSWVIEDMKKPEDIVPEGRPVWDFEMEEEEVISDQGLWAGLNFAPGVFDPNFSNSTEAATNLARDSFNGPVSPAVTDDEVNQGFSYAIAVNAGYPLGERWIVESGLGYSVGNSETTTSLIVENGQGNRSALVFTNTDQLESFDNSVSISAPTDVNSSYEFISVPVKAGYAILRKEKLAMVISAGISYDFFLQNTISSGQQGVGSFRQGSGGESPFRPVFFSGLSSMTFTYELGSGYLIMLEPSYKMALNNFSRNDQLFESRPNSFGVGIGIRYQFGR